MKKLLFLFLIIPFQFGCSTTQKSPSEFSIKFVVDKKMDTEMIFNMFRPNEPGGLANRALYMGIDYDFAKEVQDAKNYNEVKKELDMLVDTRYTEIGNGLLESVKTYSESWESCMQEFSMAVTEITEHDWFYKSYTCVVSAFHLGISNWYGNIILRKYGENPIKQRYATAWEIVLSHIFHITRRYFTTIEAPDQIIWAISEITAVLILEDNKLSKLWGENYHLHANSLTGYPQLFEIENKIKTAYENRADFRSYLNTAIQIAKESNFGKTVSYENSVSIWLLTSIPKNFNIQPTPVAIGWNDVMENSLSVNLVEPLNYQGRGWWTFTNKNWTGKGEYYILLVPIIWNQSQDGSFQWDFRNALIYTEDSNNPLKMRIETTNVSFFLNQFKKLLL